MSRRRCCHENAELKGYSGDYHFYAGEVWDDLREEWYCPQCGRFLTAKEVAELKRRQIAIPPIADEEVPF